jgi:hypothetical protein
LQQHCEYAHRRLNVKYFANYVAANFLNPHFNYDTPLFWGVTPMAHESGYRQETGFFLQNPVSQEAQAAKETGFCGKNPVSQDSPVSQWEQVFAAVAPRLNRSSFNTWLRPTTLLSADTGVWRIGVPDETFVYWLNEYYHPLLRETIARVTGQTPQLEFVVQEGKDAFASRRSRDQSVSLLRNEATAALHSCGGD